MNINKAYSFDTDFVPNAEFNSKSITLKIPTYKHFEYRRSSQESGLKPSCKFFKVTLF